MGIYDRDYYRQVQRPGLSSYAPRTVVVTLIAVNVAVWIADFFSEPTVVDRHTGEVLCRWLSDHLATHVYTLTHPLYWWQFLSAGFAHAPNFQHILGNMLVLFFLGRDVEEAYGPKEFLRLYLVMVVFGSVVWSVVNKIGGAPGLAGSYGASGAITGIVILYAFNFPHRTLLLFFVIPMPAWLAGALWVGLDMFGALGGRPDSNVAFSVHLAGAAFAFIYYQRRWNLTRLTADFRWPRFLVRRKPRLRVHRPEQDAEPGLNQEVDRILEKISRQGEASLTAKERHTLETASREYQKKMTKRK